MRFARGGWTVFAGVRRVADGEALAREGGSAIRPLLLDVTDVASIVTAFEAVSSTTPALDALVNNAGTSLAGPMELLPAEELRAHFALNFFAPIELVQTFLPLLRAARGRIINVSSIQGRFVAPFLGAYAASKHALEAACDALRVELAPWGIKVVAIEPGAVRTPIWQRSSERSFALFEALGPARRDLYDGALRATRTLAERLAQQAIDPDVVARTIERAVLAPRPKARYLVGTDARVRLAFARLPDALRDRLYLMLIERIKARLPKA